MGNLTDIKIKKLPKKAKQYRVADGLGLFITVKPSGAKLWHYRYQVYDSTKKSNYREKILSLGQYPIVTLAQARADHTLARAEVKKGVDVALDKKLVRSEIKTKDVTFQSIAEEWLETWSKTKGKTTIDAVRGRLENKIFPFLAKVKLADIKYAFVSKNIKRIYLNKGGSGGQETARRCIFIINMVMRNAVMNEIIAINPLERLLSEFPKPKIKNLKAITDPEEYGKFIYDMDGIQHIVGICIRLLIHVPVRESAMLNMKWSDIDWKKKQWIYLDTKVDREHIVPLSTQAIALLKEVKQFTGHHKNVFYSTSKVGHISPQAMLKQIRLRGWGQDKITIHGFRSSFATMCEEVLEEDLVHIEMSLNHAMKGALGDTYRRGKFIPQRTKLMQRWSDFVDDMKRKHIKEKVIKSV